ncbi:MAG TPA: ABC transporter substrate-binding protein [Polyangiaceae bacterium]|nr:ABC transporter substrate-binding protein [Polyangiaceae bacterium]
MAHPSTPPISGDKAAVPNVFGRYRLIADIGRGGMSDVYLAVTEGTEAAAQFQKLLVIKMLKRELGEDPDFVKMFLNEARLAARLNHPNIVQTIEIGNAGSRYFLAMEYLEGQPLHRVFRSPEAREGLSLAMRLHILVQALGGLHYAHERSDYDGSPLDIVHRDISPSNLFVTYDGQVKLMDFGIAKARDSEAETRVGVFKGKAAYVAPEQVKGDGVDRRADVYSAGVLLWEMITGRRLWAGLTQSETLKRVMTGEVPTPSSIDPRVPRELERIVMKALALHKEERFETAADLATELERFSEHLLPAVIGRDVGSVVSQAFTEDRTRIRQVIEAQLARQAPVGSSLPELSFMADTGRNSFYTPDTHAHDLPTPHGTTATLAAQGIVTPSGASSRPKSWLGIGALGALAVVGLASIAFAFFPKNEPGPTPAAAAVTTTPAPAKPVPPKPRERGVSDSEIEIGMSAVFSGPSRELGQNMKLGVETSFMAENAKGGVHGRRLTLTALDDGYEAARSAETMRELLSERQVFAFVGNVGTPTSAVAAPFASQNKAVFFGAFTGAPVLRQDPPDRYVFNYRASYREETARSVKYLLDVQKLAPESIVVFAQDDSFGDAGFEGVTKALRANGHNNVETLRVGYKRNTTDVDEAINKILAYHDRINPAASAERAKTNPSAKVLEHPVKAVVMVATYRAAAKFIQKMHAVRRLRNALFFNVSFVGSETLAEELAGVGTELCNNVYVTQVVPPVDSGATGVRRYRDALAKYQPQAQPGFVSLEGFIVGEIFVEALKRTGPELTTERLVDTLERIEGLDLGYGTRIEFSLSEHQGSHKVWGTKLDESCRYQAVDLD